MAWMAAISAGAGLASSLLGSSAKRAAQIEQAGQQYAAQIRAEGNQRAQAKFQNTFQNLMISAANKRTEEIFGKQIDLYKQQQYYFSEAASIAYQANQTRLNEIYKSAKFGRLKDEKALAAFHELSRVEVIIPALESSHAMAYAFKLATKMSNKQNIIVNLSGRGDKDIDTVPSIEGIEI